MDRTIAATVSAGGEPLEPPRRIEVLDPDPSWPERFRAEAARIAEALGPVAARIEHIGSTSVPGLAAKPVLDVQISVRSFLPMEPYREPLERLGYVHRADDEPEHRFFRLDVEGVRSVNIHVCEVGSEWERRHITFRDHLRTHPEDAARYAELKRRLARRFPFDVLSYADAKTPFIEAIKGRSRTG
ncbi:GrpB family protein [soil metagenome]